MIRTHGTAVLVAIVGGLFLLASADGAPAASPPAWNLAPSDLALYDRRSVTLKDGKERRGRATPFTVHGHDLRDGGQYLPGSFVRGDLPGLLAFRVAPAGPLELRLTARAVVALRIRGELTVTGGEAPELRATYTFGSRGREARTDTHWIRDGSATVRATFDPERGAVSASRVEISYALGSVDAKPGVKANRVTQTFVYELKKVQRARYDAFQADVAAAIDRGVAFLRTKQNEDGGFPPHGDWPVGTTALAALTLASCDVPLSDAALEKALSFVCDGRPDRTYALALSLMALDRAYTPADEALRERRHRIETFRRKLPPGRRAWAKRAAELLESQASSPGVWTYRTTNPSSLLKFDSSNIQYGVLGMRAATRLGFPAREATWTGVIRTFRQVREREGPRGEIRLVREGEAVPTGRDSAAADLVHSIRGFRYATLENYRLPWASMTCAGISSLSIARDQLKRLKSRRLDRGTEREIDEMTASAWAWLDTHWAMDRHPEKSGNGHYYYYLYSLERAGLLTGVKRVGGKDWYFEGAVQLFARQKEDGSWSPGRKGQVVQTCFALLFLKRATAPITHSGR